jgi:hypothetical protein
MMVTKHITALAFRREAIGGVQSISFTIPHKISKVWGNLRAYQTVSVCDARSGQEIAGGWIADTGRTADSQSGHTFDVTCFGAATHADDKTVLHIIIDQSLHRWQRSQDSDHAALHSRVDWHIDVPALEVRGQVGHVLGTSWNADWSYRFVHFCGRRLAYIEMNIEGGTDVAAPGTNFKAGIITRIYGGGSAGYTSTASLTSSAIPGYVYAQESQTNFGNTDDEAVLRLERVSTSLTATGQTWCDFHDVKVVAQVKDKTGTYRPTAYYNTPYTPTVGDCVEDMLGSFLDRYDGAGATIVTSNTKVQQFVFSEGVTPGEMLDHLMKLDSTKYWTTGPRQVNGKFQFKWLNYPTTPRYECSVDGGLAIAITSQDLFNQVIVRYRDHHGHVRQVTANAACPILDSGGVTRSQVLDLSDETGFDSGTASAAGQAFLDDHCTPNAAGTLTIDRPIWDTQRGCWVDPWEIQPAELIRIKGFESYKDGLNRSVKDGVTVFRIWAMDYDADTNTATLELDSSRRTTPAHLAALLKKRHKRR